MNNSEIKKIYNDHFKPGPNGKARINVIEIAIPGTKIRFKTRIKPNRTIRDCFVNLIEANKPKQKTTLDNDQAQEQREKDPVTNQQTNKPDPDSFIDTPDAGILFDKGNQTYRIIARADGDYAVWNETKDRFLKNGPVKTGVINSFKKQYKDEQYNKTSTGPYFEETGYNEQE